jgi:hypothetical protein
MTDYPGEVAIDARFHVPADELPELVDALENLAYGQDWTLEFPVPDPLPYAHSELPTDLLT